MNNEKPDPLGAEPTAVSDNSPFLLHSRPEIVYVLRAIMQKTTLVTAHFNQGKDFILTSIVEIDTDRDEVILDYGANEAMNHKVLDAPKITFVTFQDKVKVQFGADRIAKTRHGGRDAFTIPLPAELLKLQRREYYRLETPITNPLKCVVSLPDGKRLDLVIADISVGGLSIVNPPAEAPLKRGDLFLGCRIALPDTGVVTASIEVRNAYQLTLKNGTTATRVGCRFVDMPPSMQAMIQRYILKLDRERRAKLSDQA